MRTITIRQISAAEDIDVSTLLKRRKARRIGKKVGGVWQFTMQEMGLLLQPGVRGNPALQKKAKLSEWTEA